MKTIVAIAFLSAFFSCRLHYNSVQGNGSLTKQARNVADFSSVDAAGAMDVEIKKGNDYQVTVEADDNLQQYVTVEKNGENLVIKQKDNINIRSSNKIRVQVQMPWLRAVSASGSGSITTIGAFKNDDRIETTLAGSGNISLNVNCPQIEISIAGSGNIVITGQTKLLDINIAGSGDFDAQHLKSEKVKVSIAGSGNAKLFASMELDVTIIGSGDVFYAGSPNISKSVIGSGRLKPL